MTSSAVEADVCIVGAGPVGTFLAALLARAGRRCALIEARALDADAHDPRTLALSWSSRLKLGHVGLDPERDLAATPIRTIHVSQAGRAGRARLTAGDAGVEALGFVLRYASLQRALLARVTDGCRIFDESRVERVDDVDDGVLVTADRVRVIASMAVVADGATELIRSLGMSSRSHDYQVSALVGDVSVTRPGGHVAYERFTDHGPLAMLPQRDGYSLVWALPPGRADELREAPRAETCAALQDAFGWRLGRVTDIRGRASFPLSLRRTEPLAVGRTVVIGNAAQTLHPVAGQGLNLGFRDAWALARRIREHDGDLHDVARTHAADRRADRAVTIGFTDLLAQVFGIDVPGAAMVRTIGLEALDLLPGARRTFARALAVTPQR